MNANWDIITHIGRNNKTIASIIQALIYNPPAKKKFPKLGEPREKNTPE